jgi:streptogramin lyase
VALATTPAGNGTVPQAEINTLGNILASCVNSNGTVTGGGSPTACYTLFTNALSGGSTGTQPGDTATAAINVAHNPAVNVASLYGLSTANPPFIGVLSQPLDWTVAVGFSGAGTYPSGPEFVAIDGSGDVWTLNQNLSVSEFSSLGRVLSGSTGYTGGGLRMPSGLAIDSAGDAWIPNYLGTGTVTEFSGSGSVLSGSSGYAAPGGNTGTLAIDGQGNVWVSHEIQNSIGELSASGTNLSGTTGYTGGGLNQPGIIGIDGSGNVWASNSGGHVSKFSSSGVALSGQSGYAVNQPGAGAVDSSGNLWITSGNSVVKMSNSGTILSGPNGYSGGGLSAPGSIVIDGAGNIWVADSQGDYITELSASGAPLSGASGFGNDYTNFSNSLAVDGSGNVWVAGGLYAGVAEFVGAAVPVITPIAAGLPTTPTADGSSNLGTRP